MHVLSVVGHEIVVISSTRHTSLFQVVTQVVVYGLLSLFSLY